MSMNPINSLARRNSFIHRVVQGFRCPTTLYSFTTEAIRSVATNGAMPHLMANQPKGCESIGLEISFLSRGCGFDSKITHTGKQFPIGGR